MKVCIQVFFKTTKEKHQTIKTKKITARKIEILQFEEHQELVEKYDLKRNKQNIFDKSSPGKIKTNFQNLRKKKM